MSDRQGYTPGPGYTPGASNKSGGMGTFVNERVPVESFSQVRPDRGPEVPSPAAGARWGRPASLNFQLANYEGSADERDPPSVSLLDENEEEILNGFGVVRAINHNGQVVAQSPDPEFDPEGNFMYQLLTVFQCPPIVEEDEETETAATGVVIITPILRLVRRFIVWDLIEELPHARYAKVLNWDAPDDPPPVSIMHLPARVVVEWVEPRPRTHLGQSGGGQKRYRYTMTGVTR